MKTPITYELVRELFDYDPLTGFVYNRRLGRRVGYKHSLQYRSLHIKGRDYREHRIVWLWMRGTLPENYIDHINGDPHDNRWCNLRAATQQENLRNARKRPSQSGFKGVEQNPPGTGRYRARIVLDGKFLHLGYFTTGAEAHEAYCAAALKHFGEFACLDR